MKLAIQNAKELDPKAKATLQASGRLGFSEGANTKIGLEAGKFFVIATNDDDPKDENLYAWVENEDTNGGFRINRAGTYYNINTKPLFDKLKIDYNDKDKIVIYDIIDFENEGNQIFKLIKRVQKRNNRTKKMGDSDK